MSVRSGLVVIAIVGSTLIGSAVASAASPQELPETASPTWTEECLDHHGDWTEEDFDAMHEAMEEGDFGFMGSTMGSDWGSMAPMMGGWMGHHGQGR